MQMISKSASLGKRPFADFRAGKQKATDVLTGPLCIVKYCFWSLLVYLKRCIYFRISLMYSDKNVLRTCLHKTWANLCKTVPVVFLSIMCSAVLMQPRFGVAVVV